MQGFYILVSIISTTKVIFDLFLHSEFRNNMVAVTGSQMMIISPVVTDMVVNNKCTPVFAGMRYCTTLQYIDASSHNNAPYFPFTGDSK